MEELVIVLGFHFALFPVEVFNGNRGKKIPPGHHFIHTHTSDKQGVNFTRLLFYLKETDLCSIDCMCGLVKFPLWIQVYYTFLIGTFSDRQQHSMKDENVIPRRMTASVISASAPKQHIYCSVVLLKSWTRLSFCHNATSSRRITLHSLKKLPHTIIFIR